MKCSDVEALWDEMRDEDEQTGGPGARARAHLKHCSDCRECYRDFEGVAYCLHCLPAAEPPQHLMPRILEHIRALRQRFLSNEPDAFGLLDSPVGKLVLAWRESGITFVGIDRGEGGPPVQAVVEGRLRRPVRAVDPPAWVRDVVEKFFSTWHADMARVDISHLSPFERLALLKAAQIPPGEVRSYGWIAREIGRPQSARAVGQVMARNPLALFFPCHRVVDASGALHNYGYGLEMKARLLRMEGYLTKR